jgi:Ca2+-binding EF-hand superfamily protein
MEWNILSISFVLSCQNFVLSFFFFFFARQFDLIHSFEHDITNLHPLSSLPSCVSLSPFLEQTIKRSPVLKNVLVGAASYIVGAKFHSRRAIKKQEKSSSRQQQKLYERYVQDVSALQLQNSQLQEYIQQSTVQQLTEEFLTADTNNDRRVSRLEFEKYKKQYLEKHPDADPGMFPRFEDFDPDHNGMVTLKEHEDYYRQQGMVA